MVTESNLFDALYDSLDRIDRIEGHKYIILITTGIDTFSKLNLDQITKKIKNTKDVTIFPISVGWQSREYFESRGMAAPHGMGIPVTQIDYLQADNEMKTLAAETGGQAFFPRFLQEYPSIFQAIGAALRNQYSLTYRPSNQTKDGTFRKIKVELVDPQTGDALRITEKGKPVKYTIVAKSGYHAPRAVE